MYAVNYLCHLENLLRTVEGIWNCGPHVSLLGHIGNHQQAWKPATKGWRSRPQRLVPFVAVTQLALIGSQRRGLCGEDCFSSYVVVERDGWFLWEFSLFVSPFDWRGPGGAVFPVRHFRSSCVPNAPQLWVLPTLRSQLTQLPLVSTFGSTTGLKDRRRGWGALSSVETSDESGLLGYRPWIQSIGDIGNKESHDNLRTQTQLIIRTSAGSSDSRCRNHHSSSHLNVITVLLLFSFLLVFYFSSFQRAFGAFVSCNHGERRRTKPF